MSVDTVLRPDIVNYKTVPMHNGRYRMRKVPLNNLTSATVPVAAASTTLVEWKIPSNTVFNPARSVIDYQILYSAPAAKGNWTFEDTFEICSSIQFGNASGTLLTDLQYANNYVSVARKIDTSLDVLDGTDSTSALYKCDEDVKTKNYFPPLATLPADNPYRQAAGAVQSALTTDEPQYAKPALALAAQTQVTRSIPLAAFTHTALGMDRDMIFGEDMYIRMQIAPSSKMAYIATAINAPAGGAAVLEAQPTLSNLYLQLAVQVDNAVEAHVREKFLAGGMSFIFPYVYGWRTPTQGAGVASVQLQLNSQYGRYLKRLIHAPFDSTEALNLAYDHQNLNGAKITQYQTALDAQPLQDSQLSCLLPVAGGAHGMDDWRENRIHCKGSAIANSAAYYYNWFHIDSFSQPKRDVLVPEDNILEGLDLSMPRSWTFTATTTKSLNHYTWGTFIREVVALPMAPTIVKV